MLRFKANRTGRPRGAALWIALAVPLAWAGPSLAGAFDTAPRLFGSAVNRVLAQVESGLRFRLETCARGVPVKCRFSSERITALVEGDAAPARIGRIVLEADLLRDRPGSDPFTMVADAVSAFGATIVAFDPRLAPDRRVALLRDLTSTALETGASDGSGMEARYSLTFDEASSGLLSITVVPADRPARKNDLTGLTFLNAAAEVSP